MRLPWKQPVPICDIRVRFVYRLAAFELVIVSKAPKKTQLIQYETAYSGVVGVLNSVGVPKVAMKELEATLSCGEVFTSTGIRAPKTFRKDTSHPSR